MFVCFSQIACYNLRLLISCVVRDRKPLKPFKIVFNELEPTSFLQKGRPVRYFTVLKCCFYDWGIRHDNITYVTSSGENCSPYEFTDPLMAYNILILC